MARRLLSIRPMAQAMFRTTFMGSLVLGLALAGCADTTESGNAALATSDGGPRLLDQGSSLADDCRARIPTEGFGTAVGRHFVGFELQSCDGAAYDFYGEGFCDAELSVVIAAAGWCPPSIQLSSNLESMINQRHAERGVRIIEVLFQTEDFGPPDPTYCQAWVERFGLSNVELIDPAQASAVAFPGSVYPHLVVVDRRGTIRARQTGYDLDLLAATLDVLLAEGR